VANFYVCIGVGSESVGDVAGWIDAFRGMLRLQVAASDGRSTDPLANAQYNVGVSLAAARRYDEALVELRQSDATYASLPVEHRMRSSTGSAIAMVLTELERYDEAESIFATLLPPSTAYDTALVNGRLGMLRSAQGRHAEALALLRGSADYFAAQPLPIRLATVLLRLGAALLADRQSERALEALQQAHTTLAPLHKNGSPDLADILVGLARAHLALGHAEPAARAAQSAVAFWHSFDPISRHAGFAQLWRARSLIATGDTANATGALEQAQTILSKVARPSDRELLERTRTELAARTRSPDGSSD
jgi:tetratricopeptide (TPR) repeat protein